MTEHKVRLDKMFDAEKLDQLRIKHFLPKKDEDHSHFCIDELFTTITNAIEDIYGQWNKYDLSCTKIKEYAKEKLGLDLYDVGSKLEELSVIISNTIDNLTTCKNCDWETEECEKNREEQLIKCLAREEEEWKEYLVRQQRLIH